MQPATLAVAEDPGEFEYLLFPCRQQLLGGEFRRGVKVKGAACPVGGRRHCLKGMQMGLVARRNHQGPAFDLGEAQGQKMPAN